MDINAPLRAPQVLMASLVVGMVYVTILAGVAAFNRIVSDIGKGISVKIVPLGISAINAFFSVLEDFAIPAPRMVFAATE